MVWKVTMVPRTIDVRALILLWVLTLRRSANGVSVELLRY